jgi:hypothetical protein
MIGSAHTYNSAQFLHPSISVCPRQRPLYKVLQYIEATPYIWVIQKVSYHNFAPSVGVCPPLVPNSCLQPKKSSCQDQDNLNQLASPLVILPYCWSGGHEFDYPMRERSWCTKLKWKTLGIRSSTLVSLTWNVLPNIEHCLSSCVMLVAWHITGRLILICPTVQQMSLIQIHVQYQQGIGTYWRELI